ncbi:hypothetical protein BDN72DRAFT_874593 [Pluteus cervinus]|uniref:Uncharacterized protein n=1 Tax=Pluteus cervinus TaxID=181527 RepID=A0ACD3BBE6_9AGAR|nr:hypothetical protein BDN72DRAFT_874593 [Pluteus cervinus]
MSLDSSFGFRNFFFARQKFCCCLPVRLGVITMSMLGLLFSGILSIALWFEISSNDDLNGSGKAAFIIFAVIETLLFVASILGFVGAIVRKQTFVQAYAYFTYVHFVLNLAVAAYFLWVITHFSQVAVVNACQDAIETQGGQEQCTGLFKVAKGLYLGISTAVILIEMYGVIIVARYVNQIQSEKRMARQSRTRKAKARGPSHPSLDGVERGLLHSAYPSAAYEEFDPYADLARQIHTAEPIDASVGPPVEVGYGGGSWSMQDISAEEKARLREEERELELQAAHLDHESGQPDASKSPSRPSVDNLPRYSLTDLPAAHLESSNSGMQ